MSEDVKKRCEETNIDAVRRWAEENQLDVVFPQPDELFLDIDDYSSVLVYEENKDLVEQSHGILGVTVRESRSGHGKKHYVVKLNRSVTVVERIALQAILGSDRRHEAQSLRRHILDGEIAPTLFFEKKCL
jgi:TPP-dependent indolepyruvate ferredoxin oxidoreductase alpha subunit